METQNHSSPQSRPSLVGGGGRTTDMIFKKNVQVLLVVIVSGGFAAACQSKGPAPGQSLTEREDVIMAERQGAPSGLQKLGIPTKEYERDYRSIPHDPHGPAAHLNPPSSHVSGHVDRIDVGGLTFTAPEGWQYQHPASAMRRAELGVREDGGTAGLVVYYFGDKGAGSPKANIDRWVSQFQNADGTPATGGKPVKRKVAGLSITQIEVDGQYVGGMGSGTPQATPDQRMIATIVETPNGPFYFKFLGAGQTVHNNREALEALFQSMQLSQ